MQHRGEIALERGRAPAGQLEEVGVPLVGHDARAGGEARRKHAASRIPRRRRGSRPPDSRDRSWPSLDAPEEGRRPRASRARSARWPHYDRCPAKPSARAARFAIGAAAEPHNPPRSPAESGRPGARARGNPSTVSSSPSANAAAQSPADDGIAPALMGVSGPEPVPVQRGKGEQRRPPSRGRPPCSVEQIVLEVEPEVTGDLVVPRAAGVEPFTRGAGAPGQPDLDRGMGVLVLGCR